MNFEHEKHGLSERYRELVGPVFAEVGTDLYDLSYTEGNHLLRIFIFHPESMSATLDDCAEVDRALSDIIENCDWVNENIVLEVSSPGIERWLRSPFHFQLATGSKAKLFLKNTNTQESLGEKEQSALAQKVVEGEIVRASLSAEEAIDLNWNGDKIRLPYKVIKKAHVLYSFDS